MATPLYQLAANVFACLSDGHYVFLDLPRNQYFCLNADNSRVADRMLRGSLSQRPSSTSCRKSDDDALERVTHALTQQGLITRRHSDWAQADRPRIAAVRKEISPIENEHKPSLRVDYCTAFFLASISASWKLRRYSMLKIVSSISEIKHQELEMEHQTHESLSSLTKIFHYLRPLYVRQYLCLYDSLALVHFLAKYHFFPLWVFGVKTQPFSAHCWVQAGDCVLNDKLDFVHEYTPIMAI